MANPAVVCILVAAAILLVLCTMTPHSGPRRRPPRRLHVAFDPLIDEMERRAMDELEQRAMETGLLNVQAFREKLESEPGMLMHYFGEEGNLNTKQRLRYLFPLLDQAPRDGYISFAELDLWNKRQAMDRLTYSTERRMRIHDKNRDNKITLSEFLAHIPEEDRDWSNKEHGKPGWWNDLFVIADIDNDGFLNETEFKEFLHPEDAINPKVQMWFQSEKLREMDQNDDGKLSFEEFRNQTQAMFFYVSEFESSVKNTNTQMTRVEQKFSELDVNRDKFLTAAELKPLINYLHPGEFFQATYYTKHLMKKADVNKDGKLTLEEMLAHHQEFYNAVFEEEPDNYNDDDYDYYDHDEFR